MEIAHVGFSKSSVHEQLWGAVQTQLFSHGGLHIAGVANGKKKKLNIAHFIFIAMLGFIAYVYFLQVVHCVEIEQFLLAQMQLLWANCHSAH